MKINKELIKLEMTEREYVDLVVCLKRNAENAHISLLSAERRGSEKAIETSTKIFETATSTYEKVSNKSYDILERELYLTDRIPSLRKDF